MLELQEDDSYRANVCTMGATAKGIGLRKGDVLSVGWVLPSVDGVAVGVTVYAIKDGGKLLDGEWRTRGELKAPRTESARWVAKLKPSET